MESQKRESGSMVFMNGTRFDMNFRATFYQAARIRDCAIFLKYGNSASAVLYYLHCVNAQCIRLFAYLFMIKSKKLVTHTH